MIVDRTASGRLPIHSQDEESQLVERLKAMASVGYGYTRQEAVAIVCEFALALRKGDEEHPFSIKYFHKFMAW